MKLAIAVTGLKTATTLTFIFNSKQQLVHSSTINTIKDRSNINFYFKTDFIHNDDLLIK